MLGGGLGREIHSALGGVMGHDLGNLNTKIHYASPSTDHHRCSLASALEEITCIVSLHQPVKEAVVKHLSIRYKPAAASSIRCGTRLTRRYVRRTSPTQQVQIGTIDTYSNWGKVVGAPRDPVRTPFIFCADPTPMLAPFKLNRTHGPMHLADLDRWL